MPLAQLGSSSRPATTSERVAGVLAAVAMAGLAFLRFVFAALDADASGAL